MAELDKNLLEDGKLEDNFDAILARIGVEPDDDDEHREANAAQLMRFITAVQSSQTPPHSALENLMHVFIDVLEGRRFDTVFPLPERDRRKKRELTQARDQAMRGWIRKLRQDGRTIEQALVEVCEIFRLPPGKEETIRQMLKRAKHK